MVWGAPPLPDPPKNAQASNHGPEIGHGKHSLPRMVS